MSLHIVLFGMVLVLKRKLAAAFSVLVCASVQLLKPTELVL